MAQGFKPSKPSSSAAAGKGKAKGRSSASTGPKRGPRVIAPKKAAAVKAAVAKQKQQGSLTSQIEAEMAGRAAGGGPLKLMKKLGEQAMKEREAARAKKGGGKK